MTSEIKGNGYYTTSPGLIKPCPCDICQEDMEVERCLHGEAMDHQGHKHDIFRCPLRHEMWHLQAFKLRREAEQTVSKRMEDMLREEMKEVLEKRQHTKEVSTL